MFEKLQTGKKSMMHQDSLECKKEWLACTSRINYWNTHKPVRFILSYVLSVTQQYKQRTA